MAQGVQATSLQDIANEAGHHQARALHDHFASREELVRSIITPMVEDLEAFVTAIEAERTSTTRGRCSPASSTSTSSTATSCCSPCAR